MTNDLVFLKICSIAIIFCSSTGLVDKLAKSNTNNTYFSVYKRRFSFQAENMLIFLYLHLVTKVTTAMFTTC